MMPALHRGNDLGDDVIEALPVGLISGESGIRLRVSNSEI